MEEIIGPLLEQIYFQYGCRFKHGGHFYCDIWCLAGIGGISYALALEAFLLCFWIHVAPPGGDSWNYVVLLETTIYEEHLGFLPQNSYGMYIMTSSRSD